MTTTIIFYDAYVMITDVNGIAIRLPYPQWIQAVNEWNKILSGQRGNQ